MRSGWLVLAIQMTRNANTLSALWMMLSMLGFTVNDAMMKLLFQDIPVLQSIFLRGLLMAPMLMLALFWWRPVWAGLLRRDFMLAGLRAFAEVGGTLCFLTGLSRIPLANASAILQSLPLTMTVAAALVLGEQVGWRRWMAVIAGFFGVMVIIRPGSDGFDIYSLYILAAVGFVTLRDLVTRRLSTQMPSLLVALMTTIAVVGTSGLLMQDFLGLGMFSPPPVVLGAIDSSGWLLLVGASLALCGGYLFAVLTMRVGEVSFVSPFRYSALIWAISLGVLVFGEWPDLMTIAGIVIITASGLYTFQRERLRATEDASKESARHQQPSV